MSADKNDERLKAYRRGMALGANTGGRVAVVDVDVRNGGDVEKVRALLRTLKVRIFAEINTPGGGKHYWVAGHSELPTVHSTEKNQRLPGCPGVDLLSYNANAFLPGTQRPKYDGAATRSSSMTCQR